MCPWEEPVEVNIEKMLLFWSDDVDWSNNVQFAGIQSCIFSQIGVLYNFGE